jgi:hypothetical protein
MSGVLRFSKLLTDDTTIHFVDGTVIKGAQEVSGFVMNCCKAYNKGYMQGISRVILKNMGIGIGIGVVVGIGHQVYKHKKTKKLEGKA